MPAPLMPPPTTSTSTWVSAAGTAAGSADSADSAGKAVARAAAFKTGVSEANGKFAIVFFFFLFNAFWCV
jgi:hypothetical protein